MWVCPSKGQVWRWHSCLDCREPGGIRYSGELAARAAANMMFLGFFPSLWQLCPSGVWAWRWHSCLDHRDPDNVSYTRVLAAIVTEDMALLGLVLASGNSAPSEKWVWMRHSCLDHGDPSVLGHQLPQSQEIWPYQSLSSLWKLVISKPLWLVLLCCLAHQELKRPVSLESFSTVGLCCSAVIAGVWGEREQWWWLHTLRVTQQYHLASRLPGFLPQAFPTVIPSLTSPRAVSLPSKAWDCTPVPMLQLPAVVLSRGLASLSGVRMTAERIVCVIFIPFRLSRISCFTLSLKCFSSVPNNCLDVEIRPLLQFPHPPRQGPIPHTLLFFPLLLSSCWIWHGSMYSFPVVRYSCLLSVGLQDLLCLKVNSWGIHGERCTPHPPTPLPSWELTS